MKPTIEPLAMRDHDAAIIALFGSFEKYRNSPQLKEVLGRIQYLNEAKVKVKAKIQKDIDETQWWNLYLRMIGFIAQRFALNSFNRDADDLIVRYKDLRALPMRITIISLNVKFDKFYKHWEKVILTSGMEKYKDG